MERYLLLALGGALGAMLRDFLGIVAAQRFGPRFPVGTLIINLSACFMIGFVLEYLHRHARINPPGDMARVGFIGSPSTFSTFSRRPSLISPAVPSGSASSTSP